MKPDFALDFRDNQIALLHRQDAGWAIIGRVAMDDPDLDAAMGYLRATALGLSPRGVASKLILPSEAILFTTLAGLPYDTAPRAAKIAAGLIGRTPYDVADLVYDWTDSGDSAHLAVIARETLAEAESFAAQHRFNPVSFAAVPYQSAYDGEVWFGPTALSQTLLARGEVVERDDVTVFAPALDVYESAALEASDFELGAAVDAAGADADLLDAANAAPIADDGGAASIAPDLAVADETNVSGETVLDGEIATGATFESAADTREVWQDFVAADLAAPAIGFGRGAQTEGPEDAAEETAAQPKQAIAAVTAPLAAVDNVADTTKEPDLFAIAPSLSVPDLPDLDASAPNLPAIDVLEYDLPASDLPAFDLPALDVPHSFDAAMAEAAGKEAAGKEAAGKEAAGEEAPMAIDVPLIDDLNASPAAAATMPDTGEKPKNKSQGMLAAFSARRAAALAKAEAATNAARPEPVFKQKDLVEPGAKPSHASSPAVPSADGVASGAADGAADNAKADAALPLWAPPPEPIGDKSAPKLGAAEGKFGQAPEIAPAFAIRPGTVKHVPAKVLPPKAQDLKSMPKVKSSRGVGLGWILTIALIALLIAAAALSSYLLEAWNSFNAGDTAVAAVQTPAQISAQTPAPPKAQISAAVPAATNTPPLWLPALTVLPVPVIAAPAQVAKAAQTQPQPKAPDLVLPILAPDAGAAVAPGAPSALQGNPIIKVVSGRPALVPSPRPEVILAAALRAAPATDVAVIINPAVANARPLPRPATVLAAAAAASPAPAAAPIAAPDTAPGTALAPAADPALAGARPSPRPEGILAVGRQARLASASASLVAAGDAAAIEAALSADANRSVLALSVSRIPAARPKGLKDAFELALVSAAVPVPDATEIAPTEEAAAPPAEAEVEEDITLDGGAATRSVVAKQATVRNAMNLGNVNLIGLFGSNANRYALIRQPSGALKKLKVGDRFDGGRVAAITESEVRYEKGGELLALRMPRS